LPKMHTLLNGAAHTIEAVDQDVQVTPLFHFTNEVPRNVGGRGDVIGASDAESQKYRGERLSEHARGMSKKRDVMRTCAKRCSSDQERPGLANLCCPAGAHWLPVAVAGCLSVDQMRLRRRYLTMHCASSPVASPIPQGGGRKNVIIRPQMMMAVQSSSEIAPLARAAIGSGSPATSAVTRRKMNR
jgi:hypothetical protein